MSRRGQGREEPDDRVSVTPQGVAPTHPFPFLAVCVSLFERCFCEGTDNAAQNLEIALLQRSRMLLNADTLTEQCSWQAPHRSETLCEAACLPFPGVSPAFCPARGPAALPALSGFAQSPRVPVLRERSAQTEAAGTKSNFSFERTRRLRGFSPPSLGDRSSAEQQPRLGLHCAFPWAAGCSCRVHWDLPAPQ